MKPATSTSSLRNSLVIPTAAIMLVLCLALIGVGYWAGYAIVNTMSEQLIRHMTTGIRDHVNIMMDVPSRMLTRVRNAVARHNIALTDPRALAPELYALLRDEPDVDWLYFANEAGGLISIGRLEDGTHVILMTDKFQAGVLREYNASPEGKMTTLRKTSAYFDARRKDWYKTAKETRKSFWTKAYIGSAEPILGISISAPVTGPGGKFVGAYGLDLILTRLSNFMRDQRLGNTGRAFLIDGDGYLIASSGGVLPVAVDAQGRQQRMHPADAQDPVVGAVARYLTRHPELAARPQKADMRSFMFEEAGLGRISAAVEPFSLSDGSSWLIVSALPAADFLGAVRHAGYMALGLVALLVFAALAVGFWTVGRVLRPLHALTTSAQVIAEGGWPDVPEIRRNDEIGVLARALDNMTISLRKAHQELEQKVTERTKALSDANTKLKELDRLKSMFIASMSHELRTPLNSVIGFSSILLNEWLGPLSEEQKENLGAVLKSANHLLSLINDVIDVSKIEAGMIDSEKEHFDLQDVIAEAIKPFEKEIKAKGLSLSVESVPWRMQSDRRRLLQSVLNLVSNAVKFTEKGSVRVSARAGENAVEISVADTGIGIREEDLSKLFSPFVRLDSPLRAKVLGTGLGLYLTKKLVTEVLKGDIAVTSQYGAGSTFSITIPHMEQGI